MGGAEADRGERVLGGDVEVPVVVDARAELPVQLEDANP